MTVTTDDSGQRLDNWLLRIAKGVPKSHVYKLVRSGEVRINGGRVKVSVRLKAGDVVRVPQMRVRAAAVRVPDQLCQVLRNSIVLNDEDFLVVNKPAGIAVHAGTGLRFGAIDGLRQAFDNPQMELVHRLDRGTSGALLVAKSRAVCRALQQQFRTRVVGKQYLALVGGRWPASLRTLTEPLTANAERAGERRVVIDHENGKASTTHIEVQEHFQNVSLLAVTLDTGRTHQIRVHTATHGHAVVGDERYGSKQDNLSYRRIGLKRMYLHSAKLSFQWQQRSVTCDVPVDNDWMCAVQLLRQG